MATYFDLRVQNYNNIVIERINREGPLLLFRWRKSTSYHRCEKVQNNRSIETNIVYATLKVAL